MKAFAAMKYLIESDIDAHIFIACPLWIKFMVVFLSSFLCQHWLHESRVLAIVKKFKTARGSGFKKPMLVACERLDYFRQCNAVTRGERVVSDKN